MTTRVTKELYEASPGVGQSVVRAQVYVGGGLRRVESRFIQRKSDHSDENMRRFSEDNGRTWADWEVVHNDLYRFQGSDELYTSNSVPAFLYAHNPVHDHLVGVYQHTIYLDGHVAAFKAFWGEAKAGFVSHAFLHTSHDEGCNWGSSQLVRFEEGDDFDEGDWRAAGFLQHNRAQSASNSDITVTDNGDIIFPLCSDLISCCRILGLDVTEVFPSCAEIMRGLIVMHGVWSVESGTYILTPSRPIVIGDLQSSRGVNEPALHMLGSGRIICVIRGSNQISASWNTRIEPGTPGYKWFTFSDDGGITWTEAVPWHYDNGEVFYSSSSIHRFLRSSRDGKLYWFGNISGSEVRGNHPRYPLVMVEVDENTGFLKSGTSVMVDDRESEREHEELQLSNFGILEDRESGIIELYMTRLGTYLPADRWRAHSYRYFVELG